MAFVYLRLNSLYSEMLENGDKRTDTWPLVYSPVPVALIHLLYLCVVQFGPSLMRHCTCFDLRPLLIVYNFSMVGLCAYMCYEFLVTSWLSNYSLICQPVDYSRSPLAMRMASVCWWFFVSKIIELSDTVFFILRKKKSHLTFLHVYHHASMIWWWALIKYLPGGQTFFHALLNTVVHTVMYTYYGLAAIGPHMEKYLWWKRYLTKLQLAQFMMYLVHTTCNLATECDYPNAVNITGMVYVITLVILFSNFYYQSYLRKKTFKQSV
ncbi:elongation of very long chain fatty acids protein 4-like [Boleophthalmus pectinirostris]|uniref:elongation of very long chain fatty acids protein 4-like n=1 Tax=Boleophthalmus pectinirostris TaxID=150288 RepID=UPI00242ED27C|nr:elongation of very long chain fatty acids protein 4-like [Boleophthalmus pectinirostris]